LDFVVSSGQKKWWLCFRFFSSI